MDTAIPGHVDTGAPPAPQPAASPTPVKAIPVRHAGRWVATVIVLGILALVCYSLVTTPGYRWDVVSDFLFNGRILNGLVATLYLTAIAMAVGVVLGIILAVMRLSPNPVVSSVSWVYIWFFRGTPVLVQILLWINIAALYPRITIGIPFGPTLFDGSANTFITPLVAAILGLGLNEAAYMAEIVRAGIISVDPGQAEAAQALGMTRLQLMRRIVLPQAMRVIIPPTGNETISMLKTTSLVSVAAFAELLYSAQLIYAVNFLVIPLLITASIWYLLCTSVLTVIQYYVERRFARGSQRELPLTPLQRFKRVLLTFHAPPPAAPINPPGTLGGLR